MRLCAGSVLAELIQYRRGAWAADIVDHAPALLVDRDGKPLTPSTVPTDEALVFAYPWRAIPCFLINLGSRRSTATTLTSTEGAAYQSPEGAGPAHNLVAFVAICTHQGSYPRQDASVIRYAAGASKRAGGSGRIVCCTHGSAYDPAAGARNVAGPAPHPLLPVRLEWNAGKGQLLATGSVAEPFLQRFIAANKSDLIATYGPGGYRADVGATSAAVRLSEYSAYVAAC